MTSPAQNPEETAFVLPARLILLGEALQPIAQAARQSLTSRVRPSGHEFVMLDDLIRHLDVIREALTHDVGCKC